MKDDNIQRVELRRDDKATVEQAVYRSYTEFCSRIGIQPLDIESWRNRCRSLRSIQTDAG